MHHYKTSYKKTFTSGILMGITVDCEFRHCCPVEIKDGDIISDAITGSRSEISKVVTVENE